jgi:YfiH family protein
VSFHPDWLLPDWSADGVGAVMTTRRGGAGAGPFESMNLRGGLGDDPSVVSANLAVLEHAVGVRPVFLNQVHGARVVRLGRGDLRPDAPVHEADACITTEPGLACAVQVADCLPVLLVAPLARGVGAAHAGWRGLAHGVLGAAVQQLCAAVDCAPQELQAWLGACIGPRRFEVGADVLEACGFAPASADVERFRPHAPGKWLANLPLLARDRLHAAGVRCISGGSWCTVDEPSRFFSYRRDGVTGRMAALIWIDPRR